MPPFDANAEGASLGRAEAASEAEKAALMQGPEAAVLCESKEGRMKDAVPSSPVRPVASKKRKNRAGGSVRTGGKHSEVPPAKPEDPAAELRGMIETLKLQMQAKAGSYAALGVVEDPDGTLRTDAAPFAEALKKAGISRALVTAELAGYQLPPVLSVDWGKAVLTLKR